MICTAVVVALVASASAQALTPTPSITTSEDSINLKVASGKKILLTDGETEIDALAVPLMIQNAVDTAKAASDVMYTSLDGKIATLATNISTELDTFKNDFKLDISGLRTELNNKIEPMETTVGNINIALKGKVETDDFTKAISGQTNAVNEVKTLAAQTTNDFKTAMSCVQQGLIFEEGKCVKPKSKNFQISKSGMRDTRPRGCWERVADRHGNFEKAESNTWVKMTYSDVIGYYMNGRYGTACRWRMMINGRSFREHWSHTIPSSGWRIQPYTAFNWYSPSDVSSQWYSSYSDSSRHSFEMQSCRESSASECLYGWNNNQVGNAIVFEEKNPSHVAVTRYMPDTRPRGTGWSNIPRRTVVYTVKETGSMLEISYSDTIGYHQVQHNDACGVRLTMNNKVLPNEYRSHSSTRSGWRINPGSLKFMVPASQLKKGSKYTFNLQSRRFNGASECLFGWSNNQNHNTFSVEEITPAAQKLMAITKPGSFADVRPKSNKWETVPGREVSYTKKDTESVLRITLADTWGIDQRAHTTACRVALWANNKAYDMKEFWSHAGTGRGWRINPHVFTWYCKNCPKGALKFSVKSLRNDGATTCLFGWPSKIGFLKVEEIPKI